MTPIAAALSVAAATLLAAAPAAAAPERTYYAAGGAVPPGATPPPGGMSPPFSAAVRAGDTIYVAGTTDRDPATGKPGATPEAAAKLVLDSVKGTVEKAGLTMDDLVWVQIFCSDLAYYDAFNKVYRGYFHGNLPARAFLGVDHLLGGAHYEVMGIAVASR